MHHISENFVVRFPYVRAEGGRHNRGVSHNFKMKRTHAPTLYGIIGIAGWLTILFAFPVEKVHPAVPTIKVPGAYPYEEPVRIPAPTILESSALPSPAPFPYRDSVAPVAVSSSRVASARRPLTAKAVREVAFKYNGVASFCEFLAVLPADVGVFDPKLGRMRTLVEGGRVIRKNVRWLGKHEQARLKPDDRAFVSVEELGMRKSGI
jgi:hypothetical protein